MNLLKHVETCWISPQVRVAPGAKGGNLGKHSGKMTHLPPKRGYHLPVVNEQPSGQPMLHLGSLDPQRWRITMGSWLKPPNQGSKS